MGRIGMPEIIVIAVVIMLLFGAKKLPEFAKHLAEAFKIFKKASHDTSDPQDTSSQPRDNDKV